MRALLSEGSGLTSRQVATRLDELGHEVEVLSSTSLCLARFTRHVRRLHSVPLFGLHPLAWLEAAISVARDRRVDVLFPTQEQTAVLSAFAARVPVPTMVPPFRSLRRVQDKLAATRTLGELALPQPRSLVATCEADLLAFDTFPAFVKRPISTASTGVRRVRSAREMVDAACELGMAERGVVVQAQAEGRLAMVQAVADRGRLVAWHANVRVHEGANGSAAVKESIPLPVIGAHLATLVAALEWHGAIALDAILSEDDAPVYIDINPRLVEPRNACLAGVDLVASMLSLAAGEHPAAQPPGRAGVRSHQLLLAILGAAQGNAPRLAIAGELVRAARHTGPYVASIEELTPTDDDPRAGIPTALAAAATLAWPRAGNWFGRGTVEAYALTPEGWDEILAGVDSSAGVVVPP